MLIAGLLHVHAKPDCDKNVTMCNGIRKQKALYVAGKLKL